MKKKNFDITLLETSSTTLNENGFWQHYSCKKKNNNKIVVLDGFLLFAISKISKNKIKNAIKKHISEMGGIGKLPKFINLSDSTDQLIRECHKSENEMYFMGDSENDENQYYFNLNDVINDIDKWHLNKYFDFGISKDDPLITVYGGISEAINFIDF